jgi:hypothetical protein
MSSFAEQTSLRELADLLERFLVCEEEQGKTPVFSAFMKDDDRRAQTQKCLSSFKSDTEKPMQTLNRVFAGQFHFGPFTGPNGKIYPDRISVCGDGDTAGSSVVYSRIVKRVSSPQPCRYGSQCKKGDCPFMHPELKESAPSASHHGFHELVLSRAEGALTYILAAEKELGTPFQVAFGKLLGNTAFERAVNLGRPLDERTLLDLILALRLSFSPSTGIISLPSV